MVAGSPYVLAVDLGTSAVKVAVVDPAGVVVAGASELHVTRFTPDGGAEQDADAWWEAIGRCARAALDAVPALRQQIGVVAVTSQYMSIVAVDATGHPVAPVVMWTDRRGGALHPLEGNYDVWGRWLEVHGLIPLPDDDIGHIHVLRAHHPEHLDRVAAYVEPADAITARMTGSVRATPSTAFPLMCTDNRVWADVHYDDEFVALCGVDPALLPPIVDPLAPLGPLTSTAAEHLGLPTPVLVMPGTIDSITSALGCGALDESRTALVIGTTSVMATHISEMRNDLGHGLSTVPSPIPGRWFVMAENGMGGKALDLFVNGLVYADDAFATAGLPSMAPADAYERAERAAASVPAGSGCVQFLPWLVGSIAPAPDDDVRGGFLGVGLSTTRAHLARAVYEGVALNAAWLLGPFCEFVGRPCDGLVLGGGGARSDLWSQVIADATGVAVTQLADPAHTNARGAAFLALSHLGHLDLAAVPELLVAHRSEERRVGKECRSRWSPYH